MTNIFRKMGYNLLRLWVIIKVNFSRALSAGENSAPVVGAKKAIAFAVMALITLIRLLFRILNGIFEAIKKILLSFKTNITAEHSRVRIAYEFIKEEIHEFKYGRRPRTVPCLFLVSVAGMIVSLS